LDIQQKRVYIPCLKSTKKKESFIKNGLKALVASAIRPLRSRRRTAQRGKPMTQSQRWGKVTTMAPTPEGEITTTEILVPEVVPVEEVEEE
jgi:hypothetical protein